MPTNWLRAIAILLFVVLTTMLGGLLVMFPWNLIMPEVFGLPKLNWLESSSLVALLAIIRAVVCFATPWSH